MDANNNVRSRFDDIDDYDSEIPAHVAEYLNDVKTDKNLRALRKYLDLGNYGSGQLKGIDLGCGTGGNISHLQRTSAELAIDGLDSSEKQIEHAKRKGLTNAFIHASMSDMVSVRNEEYDFSYAINSIHHLPSIETQTRTFDEVYRILRPDGIFIVHEINAKNPIIRFYMNHVFPRIRSIDDGSEIWLTERLVRETKFIVEEIDYFTFVPDFTPALMMGILTKLDQFLSNSMLSVLGAHVEL